jgi:hypothetical protein
MSRQETWQQRKLRESERFEKKKKYILRKETQIDPPKQQGWVMVNPMGNTDFRKSNEEKKRDGERADGKRNGEATSLKIDKKPHHFFSKLKR